MPKEKIIGKVTHYFSKVEVAVVKLEDNLKIGDQIKLKRGEEEFEQSVKSMQIEHENLEAVKKGKEVGLKVDQKVKEGWKVYKII